MIKLFSTSTTNRTIFDCLPRPGCRRELPIKKHSSNDWELIAVLLGFREPNCAILSNDKDFWGTGVPVWTLDRIKSYLDGFRPCA